MQRVLIVNMLPSFWSPQERLEPNLQIQTDAPHKRHQSGRHLALQNMDELSQLLHVLHRKIPRCIIQGSFLVYGSKLVFCVGREKNGGFLRYMVRNLKPSICCLTTSFLYTSALRHFDIIVPADSTNSLVLCRPRKLVYWSITDYLRGKG